MVAGSSASASPLSPTAAAAHKDSYVCLYLASSFRLCCVLMCMCMHANHVSCSCRRRMYTHMYDVYVRMYDVYACKYIILN